MRPGERQVNLIEKVLCRTGRVYESDVPFLSLISVFMPVMNMALQGDIEYIELD